MTVERPRRDSAEPFAPPPAEEELATLYARLVAKAEDEGLVDVAYRTIDTPVGTLLLAATPSGLARVAYEREGLDAVLRSLAGKISPRVLRAPRRLDEAARQLEDYFFGRRTAFDLPLDLSLPAGFRRSVLAYLPAIRYGETASYQSVAAAVHNPKAVRAVGTACATNPLPVVIPCHRVIRSDGQLGAYLGGPEIKHKLLELEAQR
ncbi:MAG TPA: methylated-DNA--[protein]-cysteine S-methyltransferase [Acidimicrobiales bacterium]|nr:methylated-DNA--[protein]-cysteine S-methyltransferase [Acidimicrobiales bacterium]